MTFDAHLKLDNQPLITVFSQDVGNDVVLAMNVDHLNANLDNWPLLLLGCAVLRICSSTLSSTKLDRYLKNQRPTGVIMKLQLINEINILKIVVCFGSESAKDPVLYQPKIRIRKKIADPRSRL